jgi:xylulokinase
MQQAQATSTDVACVGFSGQMHGAVLLDAAGDVIRPAIIWCDQRTEKQSRELEKMFGLSRIIQLTCNPPLTNFTLTKLLWVRENELQNWIRVRHVMLPKDYIRYRLTGDRAIDMADASGTLMLDVTNRRWSIEILRGAKIPQEWLPSLYESPDVCGRQPSPAQAIKLQAQSEWELCALASLAQRSARQVLFSLQRMVRPSIRKAGCTPSATRFPAAGT